MLVFVQLVQRLCMMTSVTSHSRISSDIIPMMSTLFAALSGVDDRDRPIVIARIVNPECVYQEVLMQLVLAWVEQVRVVVELVPDEIDH